MSFVSSWGDMVPTSLYPFVSHLPHTLPPLLPSTTSSHFFSVTPRKMGKERREKRNEKTCPTLSRRAQGFGGVGFWRVSLACYYILFVPRFFYVCRHHHCLSFDFSSSTVPWLCVRACEPLLLVYVYSSKENMNCLVFTPTDLHDIMSIFGLRMCKYNILGLCLVGTNGDTY